MIGVSYARFSSDNQRDESIVAQQRAIQLFAQQHNIEIVKQYVDKAKSATTDKRPAFQQLIHDSQFRKFEVVVVHKLDRFSRDRYDSAIYKRKLRRNEVKLMSVMENIDGSPESVMMESLLEGMAEYYSKNLAREVIKGMKETAYQCKHTGGIPALGYEVDEDKHYIINPKEAVIVKEIFERYIDGQGYKEIRTQLNQKGYVSKLGNPFSIGSIRTILCNERYTGTYIFNLSGSKDYDGARSSSRQKDEKDVIRIEGGIPQIISKETYQKAEEMRAKRKHNPAMTKAKEIYLLQGLIRCGECGSAYEGNRRKPRYKPLYVSYRCGSRRRKRDCTNTEIRREYIEGYVIDLINEKVLDLDNIMEKIESYNSQLKEQQSNQNSQKMRLMEQLETINQQIENIVNAISSGFYQEEFKEKMELLKEDKIEVEEQLEELNMHMPTIQCQKDDLKKRIQAIKINLNGDNLKEKQHIIQQTIKEIIIYQEKIEIVVMFGYVGNSPVEIIDKYQMDKRKLIHRKRYVMVNR